MSLIPGLGMIKNAIALGAIGIIVLLVIDPVKGIDIIIRIIVAFFDVSYRAIVEGLL